MQATNPRIFISYSHDSDNHKEWVRNLAQQLTLKGIETVVDQWDLRPGDDATLYMEKGVRECDRVLLVVTSQYVAKTQEPRGGVGYERMVVTSEIARNITTNKFLPVLRDHSAVLPSFLGPRIYVDFTNDSLFQKSFDALVRDIYNEPRYRRPKIGTRPIFPSDPIFGGDAESSAQPSLSGYSDGRTSNLPKTYHWHRAVHR